LKPITRRIWNALGAILHFILAAIFASGVVGFATATNLTIWQKIYAAVVLDSGIVYLIVSGIVLLRRKN